MRCSMQEQQMELAVGAHDHQLLEYFLTCWSNAPLNSYYTVISSQDA